MRPLRLSRFLRISLALLIAMPFLATTRMYGVDGPSMMPAITVGDHVLVTTLPYLLHGPERGDVVLFSVRNRDAGMKGVKRIVAVGGDTVELRENRLYLNGSIPNSLVLPEFPGPATQGLASPRLIQEDAGPLHLKLLETNALVPQRNFGPLRLIPGEYFLLGDYRNNSNDSRFFGPVRQADILGKVLLVMP